MGSQGTEERGIYHLAFAGPLNFPFNIQDILSGCIARVAASEALAESNRWTGQVDEALDTRMQANIKDEASYFLCGWMDLIVSCQALD